MVSKEDDTDIKLADFGLSLLMKNVDNCNVRCGTPGYVPPEIMKPSSTQPVTPKVDIFSLGCMMFRLLTGMRIFNGSDPKSILKANKEFKIDLLPLLKRRVS